MLAFSKINRQNYQHPPSLSDGDILYEVPFIHQRHINLCGDASINMLFAFMRKPHCLKLKNSRGIFEGLNDEKIKEALGSTGIKVAYYPLLPEHTLDDLAEYLAKGVPIICTVPFHSVSNHYVLLIGKRGGSVVIHDPWRGPNLYLPGTLFIQQMRRAINKGDDAVWMYSADLMGI